MLSFTWRMKKHTIVAWKRVRRKRTTAEPWWMILPIVSLAPSYSLLVCDHFYVQDIQLQRDNRLKRQTERTEKRQDRRSAEPFFRKTIKLTTVQGTEEIDIP